MEIVTLIIGWFLGVVSPGIAANIQRPRKRKELSSVLARELRYLRGTMAMVAFRLGSRAGLVDEDFLNRIRPTVADLDEVGDDRKAVVALKEALALTPEQITEGAALGRVQGRSVRVVPYRLPFLENQVSQIGILPGSTQERVLRVQYHLDLYNGQAEFVMSQFALTFDSSIEGSNREAVLENVESSCRSLAGRAVSLAEFITSALEDLEGGPKERVAAEA